MRRRYKRKLYLTIILFLFIGIGVGYASLTSSLNITGYTSITKNTWNVHFANIKMPHDPNDSQATLTDNNTLLNITTSLKRPGEYIEIYVDVVNEGTIDANLKSILNTTLTAEEKKYLEYTVTNTHGQPPKEGDPLKAGTSDTLRIYIKYRDDAEAKNNAPTTNKSLIFTLKLNYVQDKGEGVKIEKPKVCRRATILHTEECAQTDSSKYCSGAGYTASGSKGTTTITYGSLGTNGTLSSGDAFDCDVNNDGTYDPVTERFYYVSPSYKDGTYSDKHVTLIYYNNTTAGLADNTTASIIAYDSSNENYHGPRTGYVNLPSVSQWSNPDLVANMTRQIRTQTGTTSTEGGVIEGFTYTGKAARFLTAQEVNRACNITVGSRIDGELDSCNYLMENTTYSNSSLTYGYWLESPRVSHSDDVWYVFSSYRRADGVNASYSRSYGARPVITVLKSNLAY